MKKNVTIKMIAEQAGVAKSTVSRVLNNNGYVSKETKVRIEQIMSANSYSPSAIARGLSKQHSNVIGFLIPEIENPFYSEVLQGVSEVAETNDLALMFCNTCNDISKELRALSALHGHRVLGLILTPAAEYTNLEEANALREILKLLDIPVVFSRSHSKKLSVEWCLF